MYSVRNSDGNQPAQGWRLVDVVNSNGVGQLAGAVRMWSMIQRSVVNWDRVDGDGNWDQSSSSDRGMASVGRTMVDITMSQSILVIAIENAGVTPVGMLVCFTVKRRRP